MIFHPWDWSWWLKTPPSPWLQALMWVIGCLVVLPVWIILAIFLWGLWWVLGFMWVLTAIVIIAEVIEVSI